MDTTHSSIFSVSPETHGAPAPLAFAMRADWGVTGEQPSRWITRERPRIDRIACPWLIRRFIDLRAEFFYVPTSQVLAQATEKGAVAYDTPGAPVSHVGELCSFDALLQGVDLADAALYAWCRDRVAAQDEPHNWKSETMVVGAPA